MMRRLPNDRGYSTCDEHGGRYTDHEAGEHLLVHHEAIARLAERILDANRDHLPVNPAIHRFETAATATPDHGAPLNRRQRREAQRRSRRAGGAK